MKILLITPPYHCGVLESAGQWQNLAFAYVAGHLRDAGLEPVIYDAMSAVDDLDAVEGVTYRRPGDLILVVSARGCNSGRDGRWCGVRSTARERACVRWADEVARQVGDGR